jgi:uroporphyrin-III C-methyltransferase/precorrin-2 dehydrogenase/sirohydrochlorin ferrochelatase
MIFGRAGEEIACLQQAGISVDVVPGITAASAMASQLGISLTHRDCAQSVRFVTGHSRKGALPDNLDWTSLTDPHTTTIYYMAGRTAGELSGKLIAAGLSRDTPATIMQSITRGNEKRWSGSLSSLPAAMEHFGYEQPVLVGIGTVFQDPLHAMGCHGSLITARA